MYAKYFKRLLDFILCLFASEKAPETLKLAAVFEKDPAGRIAAAGDILNQWKMEYRRML